MPDALWSAVRLRLYADIGDDRFDDIIQYTDSFELNGIPLASLVLAVGRNVATKDPARIHKAIHKMRTGLPVKVYLQAEPLGRSVAADNWAPASGPDGVLIFEGTTVGTGWRRANGSASFTVHLQHWLSDLNSSSSISGASHPGNPAAYTNAGVFRPQNVSGAHNADPCWVAMCGIQRFGVDRLQLETDLWQKVIRPWMEEIAGNDMISPILAPAVSNKAALDALVRMYSGTVDVGGSHKSTMGMDFAGVDGGVVANAIGTSFTQQTWSSWVNTTLWGKLIGEWAPDFRFLVVPRVTDALIVPATGGLRGPPYVEIFTSEYTHCDLNGQLPQVLRAVGIVHPTTMRTGADLSGGPQQSDRGGLAALYPSEPRAKGVVLLKEPPRWLSDDVQSYFDRGPPGAEETSMSGGGKVPPRKLPDFGSILQRFAQQWFVHESLKGRTGELSGKLRFDIAPGSQVMIQGGEEQFIPADGLGENIYATVVRVSTLINPESRQAGTSFSLAHLRNEQENGPTANDTSVDCPPLYTRGWKGAPLVAGFEP